MTELPRWLVFCPEEAGNLTDAGLVCETPPCCEVVFQGLSEDPDPALVSALADSGLLLERYLDRFWLCLPGDDAVRAQTLVDAFFNRLAVEYEATIDQSRNLENIELLLSSCVELINPCRGLRVLDFGCGTGLSAAFAESASIHEIVAFDVSHEMRRFARARGLRTLSVSQLQRLPQGYFDCIIASYVLHLMRDDAPLRVAWSRMRQGGVLVANFHKDRGKLETLNLMSRLNGRPEVSDVLRRSAQHGACLAFRK